MLLYCYTVCLTPPCWKRDTQGTLGGCARLCWELGLSRGVTSVCVVMSAAVTQKKTCFYPSHTHTHTTREARRFISFLSSRRDLIFVFSLTPIRPLGARTRRTSPAEMNGGGEVEENKETFIVA